MEGRLCYGDVPERRKADNDCSGDSTGRQLARVLNLQRDRRSQAILGPELACALLTLLTEMPSRFASSLDLLRTTRQLGGILIFRHFE